jgi:hypothetical protein
VPCIAFKKGASTGRYLKAEGQSTYTVAVNSRTTAGLAALLRACDILCEQSTRSAQPLGKELPMLTYVDRGIYFVGLRLWDGRISPVAAIKVTLHNLYRPTAIIHETGTRYRKFELTED